MVVKLSNYHLCIEYFLRYLIKNNKFFKHIFHNVILLSYVFIVCLIPGYLKEVHLLKKRKTILTADCLTLLWIGF